MPRIDEIKQQVANKFKDAIINVDQPRATQFFIDIKKEKIKDVCNALVAMGGRYLVSVGYDNIERDKTLGMIHTFAFDKDDVYCAVRAAVPEEQPVMDSITPDIPNAGWSEREFMDHLGMKFSGHPKPKRLILSDDWPEGLYPLRKTVPWNIQPPSAEGVAYQLDACPDGCTVVPVGPYHPTLHEPAHFALIVDGETIKGCDYRGFMVHRGIEKLCQTQLTYNEIPFVAERICGICGSVHATSYAQAVESAGDIKISRRA
jgi:Ni,Fe-hydrogenase III component G